MTDPVPSKELASNPLYVLHNHEDFHEAFSPVLAQAIEWAVGELGRYQRALLGIQSCSTCEACRGAATLALGGVIGCIHDSAPTTLCAVCYPSYEQLKRHVEELSIHAEKWVKRALAPAHEREPPHCSTCACGLSPSISSYTVDCPPIVARGVDEIPSAHEPAADWLESKEFYEVMQAYRLAHVVDQAFVVERFEAVKAFIRAAQPPRDGQG